MAQMLSHPPPRSKTPGAWLERVRKRGVARKPSFNKEIWENRMYGLDEYKVLQQHPEEIRQETAVARTEKLALANRETRFYVVGDLSWELARYLDAESLSASAPAASSDASGNE